MLGTVMDLLCFQGAVELGAAKGKQWNYTTLTAVIASNNQELDAISSALGQCASTLIGLTNTADNTLACLIIKPLQIQIIKVLMFIHKIITIIIIKDRMRISKIPIQALLLFLKVLITIIVYTPTLHLLTLQQHSKRIHTVTCDKPLLIQFQQEHQYLISPKGYPKTINKDQQSLIKLQIMCIYEIISFAGVINICIISIFKLAQFCIQNLLSMNSADNLMPVKAIYALTTHKGLGGIEGYDFQKKYFDPIKEIQQRQLLKVKKGQKNRKHVTKRGNYLDDQTNMRKIVPGPGQYPLAQQWPQKSKLKIAYPNKKTYIDEIMDRQKKQKKPAPGEYKVTNTLKDDQQEKKKLASKKINHQDRITYLDDVQYESTLTPGIGNYNPRDRIKTEHSKIKTKPDEWRKKHEEQSKKKPPKSPDAATYRPAPTAFTLFENMEKPKLNRNTLGKVQRFKTQNSGSGLNPAKYNVIQQWRGKDKKKVNRHGVEVLSSKTTHKSVYYN